MRGRDREGEIEREIERGELFYFHDISLPNSVMQNRVQHPYWLQY